MHRLSGDSKLLLILGLVVLLVIVAVSIVAPSTARNDPRPSSYNSAPGGAEAAYLTLASLGWPVSRWDRPLDDLDRVDAGRTTLLVAEPMFSALEKDQLAGSVRRFLERGGRVVTTGATGALLLPGGAVKPSRRFGALCYTQPEGPGPLAAAGKVEMDDPVRWDEESAAGRALGRASERVEQRCGSDAVVVRLPVGRGEAVWWSSAAPLTNAELKHDADLRLLLASLGSGRAVLFDESLQQFVRSKWSATRGLPLYWLLGQAAVVFGLLVFSFSRRRGPVRLPVAVPRSSPVEFANSMGDLYEKAGAMSAATEAARRRLQRVLVREAGLAQGTVMAGPEAVVAALEARFGGVWSSVGEHLRAAAVAADAQPKARTALALVQALGVDALRVQRAARPGAVVPPAPVESGSVSGSG